MTQARAATVPPAAFGAALAELPGMGPARLLDAIGRHGPEQAWARAIEGALTDDRPLGATWSLAARRVDVLARWQVYLEAQTGVLVLGDDSYPSVLADDREPPAVLFVRGELDAVELPRVAIIGSRRCSQGGRDIARSFGRALAASGVCVVSGLALGIDGAAHEGALAAGLAPPIAVVGSGLDVVYPRRHADLWRRVAAAGAVLSEAPLRAQPEPWRFPARNRILAALADVVLVVEAQPASGSRYTVDAALDRGVPVLAVPSSPSNPAGVGSNRMLRDGCGVACDPDDVLAALALETPTGVRAPRAETRPTPSPTAARVLALLDWAPTSIDRVVARSGLSPPAVAGALTELEMAGWAHGQSGWWERVAAV